HARRTAVVVDDRGQLLAGRQPGGEVHEDRDALAVERLDLVDLDVDRRQLGRRAGLGAQRRRLGRLDVDGAAVGRRRGPPTGAAQVGPTRLRSAERGPRGPERRGSATSATTSSLRASRRRTSSWSPALTFTATRSPFGLTSRSLIEPVGRLAST